MLPFNASNNNSFGLTDQKLWQKQGKQVNCTNFHIIADVLGEERASTWDDARQQGMLPARPPRGHLPQGDNDRTIIQDDARHWST